MKPMRLLRAVVVLLMLLAIGLVFFSQYGVPSYSRPSSNIENLPSLLSLTNLEGSLDLENGYILLAMVITDPGNLDDETATHDILDLFRWGRTRLEPGEAMEIQLLMLAPDTIPVKEGESTPYFVVLGLTLEKTQIDRLLRQPPLNLDQLVTFVSTVAEATSDAGGSIYAPEGLVIYMGLE